MTVKRNIFVGTFLALVLTVSGSSAALAQAPFQMSFGPFVGGGTISDGADVRHTSGYEVAVYRTWPVSAERVLGPYVALSNSFVNARETLATGVANRVYDNRSILAGLRYEAPTTTLGHLFAVAAAGKTYSKLDLDVTTESTFEENMFGGIHGTAYFAELGSRVAVAGDLGITLAVATDMQRLNQEAAKGTFRSQSMTTGLSLTEGVRPEGDSGLDDRIVMKSTMFKLGLGFEF